MLRDGLVRPNCMSKLQTGKPVSFHETGKEITLMKMSLLCAAAVLATAAFAGETSAQGKQAPEKFQVKLETTKGDITLEVNRSWAPIGVDHFYNAVKSGFYNETRFFRVVPGFIVQFGINGDPNTQKKWRENNLKDDPVTQSNTRGTLTYATAGPNTRTTQLFINLNDNKFLDGQGFAPFAKVVAGMDVVEKINAEYGEKPDQSYIQQLGNRYLTEYFPNLDYIKKATVIEN